MQSLSRLTLLILGSLSLLLPDFILPANGVSRDGMLRRCARLIDESNEGVPYPMELRDSLEELHELQSPWQYDQSPLSKSTELAVALFCGGLVLGEDGGKFYRDWALKSLSYPPRRPRFSTEEEIKVLKSGDPRFREIALTFDDGPGPHTAPLLDVLEQHDVRASFFIIGNRISTHRALLKRIEEDGHTIGNHSWAHQRQSHLKKDTILSRMGYFREQLSAALGEKRSCPFFRLPYNDGKHNARVLGIMACLFDYIIDWSIDPRDWDPSRRKRIVEKVVENSRKRGAIVLLHDNCHAQYLPKKVDELITALKERKFTFVTLPQMLGIDESSKLKREILEAMTLVEEREIRRAYRKLLELAKAHPLCAEADEALFMGGVLARLLKDKKDEIPSKVRAFLAHAYEHSPFAVKERSS